MIIFLKELFSPPRRALAFLYIVASLPELSCFVPLLVVGTAKVEDFFGSAK